MNFVFTYSVATPGGTITIIDTVTGGGEAVIDEVLPANQTDVEYAMSLDASQIKGFIIKSAVAATIKTNSSGSPGQTINVAAGKGIIWHLGNGFSNPLTPDITKIFITNVASGLFQMYALVDVTP